MRLLIVVPHQDHASGNWVTARRFADGLTARGHAVSLCDTAGHEEGLRCAVTTFRPDLVLLLHAWRSGRPWLATACPHPFALLLTGTDVNQGMSDPLQAPVITTVMNRAAAILTQNPFTESELRRNRPDSAAKLRYLPPGVTLGTAPWTVQTRRPLAPGEVLFLCAAGIRPVKGVLELLTMSEPLVREKVPLHLAFCGPVLDDDYGRRFLASIAERPWATWLGVVPPEAMPAVLGRADLVVSNSFNEGLPNTLVEAATLGRPILARDIPGNAAVVTDGENGLLYGDEGDFLAAARRLRDDPALRRILSRPDPQRFAAEHEIDALESICHDILASRQPPASARL